jgi:hypothetical protein
LAEEVHGLVAELPAQDAEGSGGVTEAASDFVGGEFFDKIGAEGFVLALGRGLGCEEEASFLCYSEANPCN